MRSRRDWAGVLALLLAIALLQALPPTVRTLLRHECQAAGAC